MTFLLLYAFIYMAFAIVSVLVSQKLGLGSVLGYLLAGIVIGPVLGLVGKETQSIQHIAEFGVVMMLFLVGLELAPQMLWQMRHKLLGLGGLQVVLTLATITGVAMALGYSWQVGVAVGCVLSLSSTAIVLQTYNEKHLLQTQGGQAGFAVLLFQDVAAIPMLALMPLLAAAGISAGGEQGHTSGNLLAHQPAWVTASVSVAAIVAIVLFVQFVVPIALRLIIRSRVREMLTIFTLTLVVGISTLMSLVGLSSALGAFIAGVTLANSAYRHEMESHIEPFKGLFLGLFFITVGAGMNFGLLQSKFFPIIGMTLALLLIKAGVLMILGKLFRLPSLPTKLFALSLAQAGEFGFVLLSIARQSHVLEEHILDRMSLVIALSMVLTPLLFIFYDKVLAPRAIIEENAESREQDKIDVENPVILLGHGRFGQHINSLLVACGYPVTVVDNHAERVEGLTKFGLKTYYGDATNPELLGAVGLAKAKLLIVALGDQKESTAVVEFVRRHYPDLPIIARAYDRMHAYDLNHAGATYIIREIADSSIRAASIALEKLGMKPEKARDMSKFYAARDRYMSDRMAAVYDPSIPIFTNEDLMRVVKEVEGETQNMVQALLRGETVDWHEAHDHDHTKIKKGIS
ncbi:monovalent cation:proton antiporter-2 (CPA2) family protein [Kingella negevensis]|uniref:Glutathione-regulated potassium-efflux system protein KefC n=1 Tax=Kingella negevensis TaxID=1522312 RepID=A0A238HI87_9NEIS|nr:monovalent cation:proton antiporter-2 (CPA2) family protein [Kingella negevensis]MDK4696671.1 monovalent cation:proton antiporter-2 (CPA2) family protein [Kingella negevensis]SNB61800.1 Glutathione-regulated potassium-efflux system protein KefC [Kingella negevensis]